MLVTSHITKIFQYWNFIQRFVGRVHRRTLPLFPFLQDYIRLSKKVSTVFKKNRPAIRQISHLNHTVFTSYKNVMWHNYHVIGSDVPDFRRNLHKYQIPLSQLKTWLSTARKSRYIIPNYKRRFLILCLLWTRGLKILPLVSSDIGTDPSVRHIKVHQRLNIKTKGNRHWNKSLLFTNTMQRVPTQPLTQLLSSFKNSLNIFIRNPNQNKFIFTKKTQKKLSHNLTKPLLRGEISLSKTLTHFPVPQKPSPMFYKTNIKVLTTNLELVKSKLNTIQSKWVSLEFKSNYKVSNSLALDFSPNSKSPVLSKTGCVKILQLLNQQPLIKLKGLTVQAIVIKPKFFTKFILRNVGVFLTYQNNLLYKSKNFNNKSQFKKKLFSFVYPEYEKKAIFIRRKKKSLVSLLHNFSKKLNLNKNFSFKNLRKLALPVFNNVSSQSDKSNLLNYNSSYVDVLSPFHHQTKGSDNRYTFAIKDVKLSRVRFKPGYQRLWRQARQALQTSLKLNFQYQKRLTKYITRYYAQVNRYLFASSEASASNVILYSLLVPDYKTVLAFQAKHFFYLNGRTLGSVKQLIAPNDLIQIIVSLWYYIMFRWLQNWTLTRIKKFKRLVYKKGLASKYQLMKTKKRPSRYTPSWIFNTRYDNSDVKPYLEVDYLTLSVFLLQDPYLLVYYSPDNLPDTKLNIYRLYNWKYIT